MGLQYSGGVYGCVISTCVAVEMLTAAFGYFSLRENGIGAAVGGTNESSVGWGVAYEFYLIVSGL